MKTTHKSGLSTIPNILTESCYSPSDGRQHVQISSDVKLTQMPRNTIPRNNDIRSFKAEGCHPNETLLRKSESSDDIYFDAVEYLEGDSPFSSASNILRLSLSEAKPDQSSQIKEAYSKDFQEIEESSDDVFFDAVEFLEHDSLLPPGSYTLTPSLSEAKPDQSNQIKEECSKELQGIKENSQGSNDSGWVLATKKKKKRKKNHTDHSNTPREQLSEKPIEKNKSHPTVGRFIELKSKYFTAIKNSAQTIKVFSKMIDHYNNDDFNFFEPLLNVYPKAINLVVNEALEFNKKSEILKYSCEKFLQIVKKEGSNILKNKDVIMSAHNQSALFTAICHMAEIIGDEKILAEIKSIFFKENHIEVLGDVIAKLKEEPQKVENQSNVLLVQKAISIDLKTMRSPLGQATALDAYVLNTIGAMKAKIVEIQGLVSKERMLKINENLVYLEVANLTKFNRVLGYEESIRRTKSLTKIIKKHLPEDHPKYKKWLFKANNHLILSVIQKTEDILRSDKKENRLKLAEKKIKSITSVLLENREILDTVKDGDLGEVPIGVLEERFIIYKSAYERLFCMSFKDYAYQARCRFDDQLHSLNKIKEPNNYAQELEFYSIETRYKRKELEVVKWMLLTGNYKKVEEAREKLIGITFDTPSYQLKKAVILKNELKEYDAAITLLNELKEIKDKNVGCHVNIDLLNELIARCFYCKFMENKDKGVNNTAEIKIAYEYICMAITNPSNLDQFLGLLIRISKQMKNQKLSFPAFKSQLPIKYQLCTNWRHVLGLMQSEHKHQFEDQHQDMKTRIFKEGVYLVGMKGNKRRDAQYKVRDKDERRPTTWR